MKNYLLFLSILFIFCFGCEKATEIKVKDVTKEQEAEILFFINTETNTLETNLYKPTTITYDTQRQLINCKHVDVANEVAKALAHKDYRMLSIRGVGLSIPGKKENKEVYATYIKTYGYKTIEGTSDEYSDGEDLLLQVYAYDYAEAYNMLLINSVTNKLKLKTSSTNADIFNFQSTKESQKKLEYKDWHTSPSRDPKNSTLYWFIAWDEVMQIKVGMTEAEAGFKFQYYHHPVNAIIYTKSPDNVPYEVALKLSDDHKKITDISFLKRSEVMLLN